MVPGFTGLTKLSHESPARQHWAALAASESRGTPLGQANNQPTNSSSGSCQATRSKAVRNRGGRRRAIAQRLFDSDRPRDERQSSTGSPVQRHVSLSCTSGAAGIRSRCETCCSKPPFGAAATGLIPLIKAVRNRGGQRRAIAQRLHLFNSSKLDSSTPRNNMCMIASMWSLSVTFSESHEGGNGNFPIPVDSW